MTLAELAEYLRARDGRIRLHWDAESCAYMAVLFSPARVEVATGPDLETAIKRAMEQSE